MKQKMHIYIIILALTVLGVASNQQSTVANQELVLHYSNIEATSQQVETTISQLKNQLLELGVENIQLKNDESGKLTIRYYSDLDVESVRQTLAEKSILNLNFPQNDVPENERIPKGKDAVSYNLDIFEIQNGSDSNSGFDGCIVIKKTESDRYYDPNTFCTSSLVYRQGKEKSKKAALKIWSDFEISIKKISFAIPEVRAGPTKFFNS